LPGNLSINFAAFRDRSTMPNVVDGAGALSDAGAAFTPTTPKAAMTALAITR
jgi:hypothetical protein